MKHLLIVYHSQSGNTARLARAAANGAMHPDLDAVNVRLLPAAAAGSQDLLWAHGLLLGTPENFGYMSGGLKQFFDRTFYQVEGKLQPLPYALFVSAGNDGTGAVRSVQRIVNGYPFVEVQKPLIAQGEQSETHLNDVGELGLALAAGLDAGVF